VKAEVIACAVWTGIAEVTYSAIPEVQGLTRPRVLPSALLWMVWYAIAIPYIPQIIPGSDTQPLFMLVLFLSLMLMSMDSDFLARRTINVRSIAIVTGLVASLAIALAYNMLVASKGLYVPRLVAFLQFLLAFLFGASRLWHMPRHWLRNVLIVFVVFTLIYMVTGGAVESLLIRSREGADAALRSSGRGVRTLSPEPSILAVHLLNLTVLDSLYFRRFQVDASLLALLLIPLLASLSGYGFVIALTLIGLRFPLPTATVLSIGALFAWQNLASLQISGVRILDLIGGFREYGFKLFLLDSSLRTRLASFLQYIESFRSTFPFGDAFTIFSGGGFVSIVSGLGVAGLLFAGCVLYLILAGGYSMRLTLLLLVWAGIYLLSGAFGVPSVGIIIGLLVSNLSLRAHRIDSTRRP
jgi:hypothetical protein